MEKAFRAMAGQLLASGPSDLYERFVSNEWDPNRTLRANSPLHRDEQVLFDKTIMRNFEERLRVTRRLIELGLVVNIPNPFAVSEYEYEKVDGPGGGIRRIMNPIARLENEKPEYTTEKVPLYFTSGMFELDLRTLEVSRNRGTPMDTTIAARKARAIAEDIEDAVINGTGVQVSGNESHGFLDAPSAQTVLIDDAWDDAGADGTEILTAIIDAIDAAESVNVYGPFDLVIPGKWFNALRADFKTNSDKSILSRVRELEVGGEGLFIYTADHLPEDTAILYPRFSDNVRLIVGNLGGQSVALDSPEDRVAPISLFPWETHGGFMKHWLVSAMVVPNMRDTEQGQSGIVIIRPGS